MRTARGFLRVFLLIFFAHRTPTANDLSDQLVVDQSFEQLLVSLGRVSRRVLGLVVNVVLTWRRNKIKDAVMTGQRPAVLTTDDRVLLGAEFLCCETLVSVLSFVSKENVGDGAGAEWCSEVETMCFQNVIPGRANNDLIRHKVGFGFGLALWLTWIVAVCPSAGVLGSLPAGRDHRQVQAVRGPIPSQARRQEPGHD